MNEWSLESIEVMNEPKFGMNRSLNESNVLNELNH